MCRTPLAPSRAAAEDDGDFAALLAALAEMPDTLAAIVAAVPPAQWRTRPNAGGFSLVEHACHLRDLEGEAYGERLARMLDGSVPDLADFDGARVAEARDYRRQDLTAASRGFAERRRALVRRLAGLSPSERQRRGRLDSVGEITIAGLAALIRQHDCEHLAELAALQEELRQVRGRAVGGRV